MSRLCHLLKQDFARWQNLHLSDREILYFFSDGICLRLRPEDSKAVIVLW